MFADVRNRFRSSVKRETLSDSWVGLVSEGSNVASSVVGFMLLGRKLGPTDYGAFIAMYSLIAIVQCLAFAGPGLALLQTAMRSNLGSIAGNFYSAQILLTVISAAAALALAPFLFPSVGVGIFAMFLVAELVGTALVTLAGNLSIVALGFRSSVWQQITPQVVKIAVVVGLSAIAKLSLTTYGFVYMVCSIGAGVAAFLLTTRSLGVSRRPRRIRGQDVRTTLSMSSTIWAWGLHDSGDKLVMSANNLGADVGLYGAAYRLVQFGNIPVNALATSSFRSFLDPTVGNQVKRAVRYSIVITMYSVAATLGIILLAPIVLPILVGRGFSGSITMARWLAPLLITRGILTFPGNALVGLGRTNSRLLAYCGSATVGLVVYILLIPSLSWKGAVIGSYVTDVFLVTTLWTMLLLAHRRTAIGDSSAAESAARVQSIAAESETAFE
jgi:O-antigen/teichoic acid export membrane protein